MAYSNSIKYVIATKNGLKMVWKVTACTSLHALLLTEVDFHFDLESERIESAFYNCMQFGGIFHRPAAGSVPPELTVLHQASQAMFIPLHLHIVTRDSQHRKQCPHQNSWASWLCQRQLHSCPSSTSQLPAATPSLRMPCSSSKSKRASQREGSRSPRQLQWEYLASTNFPLTHGLGDSLAESKARSGPKA